MSWDSPGWKKANTDYHAERTKPAEAPRPKPNGNSTAKVDEIVVRLPITAEPPSLDSKRASAYQIRGITWFWPGRLALGKLGLIGGLPDKGKGLISADIIARCTTGGEWPCGEGAAPKGNVIWFTAEDDIEDTVVPRLVSAGADLDRIHIVGMAKTPDGTPRMFNLATDLPLLRSKIEEIGDVVLVIIDPVSAYLGVGKVNNSSTTDVRAVLAPLTKLAEEKKISIIGIMHFNKKADVTNAMLRIADSLAYVAAARHVYVVVDDAENDKARLFVKAKNNLAPDKHALRFMVGTRPVGNDPDTDVEIWAPHVLWDSQHVEVTATEAMEAAESGGGGARARRKEAEEFLRSRLAGGPVLQKDLEEEAKANCISDRTLRRAKSDLGVKAAKQGGTGGGWVWELPKVPRYGTD
jgi:putative DNA primase/helicase